MSEGEHEAPGQRRQPWEPRREVSPPFCGKMLFVGGSAGALAAGLAVEAERRGACVALAAPSTASEFRTGRGRGIRRFPSEGIDNGAGCELLVEAIIERFSYLDAAIVTVGTTPIGELDTLSLERWQQCAVTPLRRTFWLAQRIIWEFLSAGNGGRLVFVTEPLLEGKPTLGTSPNEIVGAALVSLSRSIAKEVGRRGVACNVILAVSGGPAAEDPLLPIVDAALYLASEDASFVNGEALTVQI
jgi:3-oxoacyl-[acyl-carrier protein] reductase